MGATTVAVITGVIGLAMVAVLVSRSAQTQAVLQGAGSLASSIIGAAVAPVTGNNQNSNFGSVANTALGMLNGTQVA